MSRIERALLGVLRAPTYQVVVAEVADRDRYRRVRFSAPELLADHETSPGFWIRLWIPAGAEEYQRAYTVTDARSADGTFAVDFATHEGPGVASDWVRGAASGAALRATVYGSKRFQVPEPKPAGFLFIGDAASLPAISDILGALPDEVPARVFLLGEHEILAREGDEVVWCADEAKLAAEVQALRPSPGWHAWIATESALTRRVKGIVHSELAVPKQAIAAQGYWYRGRPMGRSPKS